MLKAKNCTMKNLILFLLFPSLLFSQITITNGKTNAQLVDILTGGSTSVTISNITRQGVNNVSSKYQIGDFTTAGSVLTNLGFASGVVLSSGHTSDIKLSNMQSDPRASQTATGFSSTCSNGEVRKGGSCPTIINDITILSGSTNYYNASILEFDFVPSNTNISFRYVFGSEEYEDNSGFINYQCTSYNDKFGFIISGPGIAGGQGFTNNGRNIARLANGSEVSINSVNNGHRSGAATFCTSVNPLWTNNVSTAEYNGPINGICFNGNTKILTASQSGLTAGQTYHIKLFVADLNDGTYDSGVFLEAGSFTSPVLLPIELADFNAECNSKSVDLTWQTASERNNGYFLLERANFSGKFEEIAKITGSGTTSKKIDYSFIDENPFSGMSYYKISQVDYNGDKQFLKMISLENSCLIDNDYNVSFYQDLKDNAITINYNSTENLLVNFEILNQLGQTVEQTDISLNASNQTEKVTLRNQLSQGIYFVKVSNEGFSYSEKVFIVE